MANITIRNIPDDVLERIKKLSEIERRSLNSELLMIIERGASDLLNAKIKEPKSISSLSQTNLWRNLSSSWEDTRSTREIIEDIYQNRTMGRPIEL